MPSLVALVVVVLKTSVFLNVLALGMTARPSDAGFVLSRPWLLLRSLLAMNVIMPVLAAALVEAFDLNPALKVALVAASLSPVPPLLPRREFKAGASAPYTIGLLMSATILSVIVVPLGLNVFGWAFGKESRVPEQAIASLVMATVLSPLLIGMIIRYFAPAVAERLIKPLLITGAVLLAVGVLPVGFAWRSIAALIGNGTLLGLAAFSIAGLAVGHWLGGPDPARRSVLALSTACRHPAIALTIASANLAQPRPVMAAVMLYLIVSLLVSVAYVKLRANRGMGTGRGGAAQDLLPTSAQAHVMRLCLVGIVLLGVAACQRGEVAASKQAPPPPPPTVIVAEVPQQTVDVASEFVAHTEAVPTVDIRARVPGVLEAVRFREGSEVRRGQVLFAIQQDEYKAALQSARAQLAKAEADLTRARDVSVVDRARARLDEAKAELEKARQDVARYRPLAAAKAIPQQDLDTAVSKEQVAAAGVEGAQAALKDTVLSQRTQIQLAEAAVESAKAAVTQAELNLKYTVVESPVDGIVSKLAVDTGNLVGKGEPTLLATVSSVDPMFVDFAITEADYLRFVKRVPGLGRGDVAPNRAPSLELILADGTTFPHKGRPVFIDRAIDQKTGTIQVRAQFSNPEKLLRPGQFGRVRAVTETVRDAVLVPQMAVQELQGVKTVLVVGEGDKVAQRTVTLREPWQNFYIVSSGLKPGERVIVEGLQKARPGTQVKAEVKPPTAGAQPAASPRSAPTPAKPKGGS